MSFDSGLKRRLCCHDEDGQLKNGITQKEIDRIRNQFSKNIIPKNCTSCKKLEDLGVDSPRLEYVSKFGNIDQVGKIKYLDLTLESTCNFKCLTCSPAYSSSIAADYKRLSIPFQSAPVSYSQIQVELSAIVESLSKNADEEMHLTITGGEPSLLKSLPSFLNELKQKVNTSKMTIRLFTNLSHAPNWIENLMNDFKTVEVVVSVDAVEMLAEYIRYPTDWKVIEKHLIELGKMASKSNKIKPSINTVISSLNVHEISKLILRIQDLGLGEEFFPKFTVLNSPKVFSIQHMNSKKLDLVINRQIEELQKKTNSINNFYIQSTVNLLSGMKAKEKDLSFDMMLLLKKLDMDRGLSYHNVLSYLVDE